MVYNMVILLEIVCGVIKLSAIFGFEQADTSTKARVLNNSRYPIYFNANV
jgi:hypothetical protein